MNIKPIVVSLSLLLMGATAVADDDCHDPVANWQPRETLREQLEAEGWTVFRIKVDDGCYEVKGWHPDGSRAEAEYSPATFELMELEREDDDDDDRDTFRRDGEPTNDNRGPRRGEVKSRPSVTVE